MLLPEANLAPLRRRKVPILEYDCENCLVDRVLDFLFDIYRRLGPGLLETV